MAVDLLLVTCSAWPDGEPGSRVLDAALTEQGVTSRWVCWDDPDVDWSESLVAVRSPWDYDERIQEFLTWARSVPWMLNSAEVFAWNTDKAYLIELSEAGVPVVPTVSIDDISDLPAALSRFERAVVKPRVGAGGRGVRVVESQKIQDVGDGPWVVQPLVESVRTEGEYSIYVLGGEPRSMVRKLPSGEEIRVHEHYGGSTIPLPRTAEAAGLARSTVIAAEKILGTTLDYARVDAMRLADGTLAVSELEITEPGLYLDVLPENGAAFAVVVAAALSSR